MKKTLLTAGLFAASIFSAGATMAAASVDAGFSPEGSAQQLVLRTLDSAHESIRLMGYSFTSPEVVKSLVNARRRGVDVRMVIDQNGNRSKASIAAMNVIVNAGIPLRVNGKYKIMHDKVIITDGRNTETGSFNFSRNAAESNSENVLVVRDVPSLAQVYLTHWQSRWDEGTDWTSSY